ncbi:MFS general substrate transporter [Fomitopsis serialis]|uniref:MFS general substrate transporter n=1 Tax=Fomitopsis serialis TaxID=139415 RepID=UPI002007A949|nr:MFS general substrate transporter [Neoantrodia serialis]KAH9911656.1 MFS general substrate transporter [Neoantrodia serialis]
MMQSTGSSQTSRKGKAFWMILFALVISFFMVVLEGAAVGNASPTIASDLDISQFAWIGTAYGLSSTALLPLSGGLAQIFGRRPVMLVSLAIFAVGGALSGASTGSTTLFAGRTVQGLGGGGVLTLSSIILSDIVALNERGLYNGILGLAWSAASGVGPVIGGSFAQNGHWRWLFYMNIPFAGLAAVLVLFFVKLPTPPGSLRSKLEQIDWIGNALVMGSTTAIVIGMTWGGVDYAWSSAQVLVPLIIGGVGLVLFLLYEALWARNPLIPLSLILNRTSISGLIQTGLLSVPLTGLMYYLPVYYQACMLASPIRAGTLVFGVAFTVAPTTIVAGAMITVTKRYRPPIWFGWVLLLVGQGLLTTLTATSSKATSIGFQILTGIGIGAVYSSTYFPVLAPLPVEQNAPALALYVFLRSFAQIWGVAIGATVLQNQLSSRLPQAFLATLPSGASVAYSAIPAIPALASPLREEVQAAFAGSLDVLWRVQCALSAIGAFASLWMKGLPLHTDTDKKWDVTAAEGEDEK